MQPDPTTPQPLFGRDATEWAKRGGLVTAREIAGQPNLWRLLADLLEARSERLGAFLAEPFAEGNLLVAFTGAGSSSYAGGVAAAHCMAATGREMRAIATTDLVEGWSHHLDPDRPLLLVSFGRSGDSPESLAAVEIVERNCRRVWQLFITCNPEGALARAGTGARRMTLVMPEGSCDEGFAMTGSFTAMTLAALAVFGGETPLAHAQMVRRLADDAQALLDRWPEAARLAEGRHERVVHLGSGPLRDAAAEAALKLMELTDGEAVAMSYSPLAFRHGPKTVVSGPRTLVVSLISGEAAARPYGVDMAAELARDGRAAQFALVPDAGIRAGIEMGDVPALPAAADGDLPGDGWLAVLYVVFAQLHALFASQARGLATDRPSRSGEVSRVVRNVALHL